MFWFTKKNTSGVHLGIDIGTTSVKVVKIRKYPQPQIVGGKEKVGMLENYGEILKPGLIQLKANGIFRDQEKIFLESEVVRPIRLLLSYLEETAKEAVIAIPMYSVFIDQFRLPAMAADEVPGAVEFEARSHIPVPIEDVKLGWQIIEEKKDIQKDSPNKMGERNILLIAVPKEIIFFYEGVAKQLGLTLKALEIETASILRALNLHDPGAYVLLDIGARNTNISLVKNGFLTASHHIELSGEELTQSIAHGLGINIVRAEEFKKKEGLAIAKRNPELSNLLYPVIDKVIYEAERIAQTSPQEEIKKIILLGGSSGLVGIKEYMQEHISYPIDIADPWATIDYNPALEQKLHSRRFNFTTAVGLALY